MKKLFSKVKYSLLVLVSMSIALSTRANQNEIPYLVANNEHDLTVTASLKDDNQNVTEGVMVTYTPVQEEPTGVFVEKSIGITDERGTVSFTFTASPDAFTSDDGLEKTFSFNLEYNEESYPLQFALRNANYYDRVEIMLYEMEGFVIPAFIQVKRSDNTSRSATLTLNSGARGSIIHADEGAIFDGGLLTELQVPIEGLDVWVTMAQDNLIGRFDLSLSGSNFPASVEIPSFTNTRSNVIMSNSAGLGQNFYSEEKLKELIGTNKILEIHRRSVNAVKTLYLPELELEQKGTVIISENGTNEAYVFYLKNGERYTVRASSEIGLKKCIHQSFYWSGTVWLAIPTNRVPHPVDSHENCSNSVIYDD